MPRQRQAFTLIEMLVVIGIIGILTGLLLPAVQSARENARRSQCAANLKQMGLAALAYHGSHGCYPLGRNRFIVDQPTFDFNLHDQKWSQHVRMLPFLEHEAVYQLIDLDDAAAPGSIEARATTIPVFLCPSDTNEKMIGPEWNNMAGTGRNNYKGSAGSDTGEMIDQGYDSYEQNNGIFLSQHSVRQAQVRDGTTHTAMFSEGIRGDGEVNVVSIPGDWLQISMAHRTADEIYQACLAVDPATKIGPRMQISHQGRNWTMGNYIPTRYNHIMPPNSQSCVRSAENAFPDPSANENGNATTASSYHPGGVNLCMCDGSVRFISDGISLAIWRALGSRAGGEVHDLNYY